ncbi:hypothetical protein ADP71_26810 [Vitreoscilla sp. C1]|uniref:DUF805 domain-containing protein n=1 Tax=Vitreoscilla sp. (strain C1) TaxID=96942 RepID=UPI000CDBC679|nr:DUF805 domain-containing protein [Vitreoscilla sp. C1]AUZ05963.1 hypothetical protein ADP71_26810 [Vitreoscilla sp. C1]
MKGQILDFSLQKGGGLIQAEDGKRYLFRASEWQHTNDPSAGQVVEFVAADEKFAIQVHPILTIKKPSPEPTQKIQFAHTATRTATTTPDAISLWQHAVTAVKDKYTQFTGRSRRREYWGFFLFFNLISLGLLYLVLELLSNLVYGIQAAFSVDCSSSCLPSLKMTLLTTKVNKLNP